MRSPENPLPNNSQEMAVAGDPITEQAVLQSVRKAGLDVFFEMRFLNMITAIFRTKQSGEQFTVGEIIKALRQTFQDNSAAWAKSRQATPEAAAEILRSTEAISEHVIGIIVQDALAQRQ